MTIVRTVAVAVAVALLAATNAFGGVLAAFEARDGAILSGEGSKALLNQCSRGAPRNVTGTWTPNRQQIAELEKALPAALAAEPSHGRDLGSVKTFRRQYAGFLIGSRRIIYVNAFPPEVGGPNKEGPPAARSFDWHKQPVMVCDGGPAFFGVEYDPATKAFQHFEFNGLL